MPTQHTRSNNHGCAHARTIKLRTAILGTVDLAATNDVHAAASALKALLRELPEPILPETVLFRLQRLIKQHPAIAELFPVESSNISEPNFALEYYLRSEF